MKRHLLLCILLITGVLSAATAAGQSYNIDTYVSGNGGTVDFDPGTQLEAGDWMSNKENPDIEVGINSIYFPPLWQNEPVVYRVKYSDGNRMYTEYIQQNVRTAAVAASATEVGYGETARLTLNISDADSYQWYSAPAATGAGTLLATTTNNFYNLPAITAQRYYYCTAVKNNRGQITSNRVNISVSLGAGSIAAAAYSVPFNGTAVINNVQSASPGLAYSWQISRYSSGSWSAWSAIPGQTGVSLSYPMTSDAKFRRVASDGTNTVTTEAVEVRLSLPPVTSSVSTNGGNIALGHSGGQLISVSPANAGVYISGTSVYFPALWSASDRTYTATVSIPVSQNRIALTVTQAKRTVTLTASPLSGGYGGSSTLSVNETGADSYQWYKKTGSASALMSTTASPSYTVTNIVADAEYYCTAVKNNLGSVTSNTLALAAAFDAGAIAASASQAQIGANITINNSRTANKSGVTYAWERSFKDLETGTWSSWLTIPSQTGLTLTNKITSDTRYRRKAVYNGSVLYSNIVQVQVNVPAVSAQGGTFALGADAKSIDEIRPSNPWVTFSGGTITFGPSWSEQDITYLFKVVYNGSPDPQFVYIKQPGRHAEISASPSSAGYKQNAVLSVNIDGGTSYQWYKKITPSAAGTLLHTGTSSSYTLTSLTEDAYYYCKVVKSQTGELTSNTIAVTVALGAGQITAAQSVVARNGTAVINNTESANKSGASYSWEILRRSAGAWETAWTTLSGQTGASLSYTLVSDTRFRRRATLAGASALTSEVTVRMSVPAASASISPDGGEYTLPLSGCTVKSVVPAREGLTVSGAKLIVPASWKTAPHSYTVALNVPVAELEMTLNLTQQAKAITLTASPLSGGYGGSSALSVNETAGNSYQWYKKTGSDAALISTTASPSYTVTNIVADAEYYCTVTRNNAGTITSNTVTVAAAFDAGAIAASASQVQMGTNVTINNTRAANKPEAIYSWEVSPRNETGAWEAWTALPNQSATTLTYKIETDTRFRRKAVRNGSSLYSNEITVTASVTEIGSQGGEYTLGSDATGIDEMRPHRPDVTLSAGKLIFPPSWSPNDIVYFFKVVVAGSSQHRYVYLKQKGRTASIINAPEKVAYNTAVILSVNIDQGDTYQWFGKTSGYQWTALEVPGRKSVQVTLTDDRSFYCRIVKNNIGELTTVPVTIGVDLYGGIISSSVTEADKGASVTIANVTASNKAGAAYSWETASRGDFGWGEWTAVSGAHQNQLTLAITQDTKFRRIAAWNGQTALSNEVLVNIKIPADTLHNFIYRYSPRMEIPQDGIPSPSNSIALYTYYDGLGRPAQQIGVKAAPDQSDIITPIVYDNMGREDAAVYLPYSDHAETAGMMRSGTLQAQKDFYRVLFGTAEESYALETNLYEASSLDRKIASRKPGSRYADLDKKITFRYPANAANEVRLLKTGAQGTLSVNGYYPVSTLTAVSATSEDGITTIVFTDMAGKKILEKTYPAADPLDCLLTYYAYDQKGNLAWVIPPLASALLQDGQTYASSSALAELSFRYIYDRRNRIIEKHLPDKGPQYLVYDRADKPVMIQDALLRQNNRWLITRYDDFDRITEEKIIETSLSRLLLQQKFDNLQQSDLYDMNGHILHILVYDRYPVGTTLALPFAPVEGIVQNADIEHAYSVGNKLFEKTAVIDENGPDGTYLEKAFYYDKKGRLIQTVAKNRLGLIDRTSMKYDFRGNVTALHQTVATGQNNSLATLILTQYDPQERPLESVTQINGQTLAKTRYLYDPLGKPAGHIHLSPDGNELFRDTLRYNIQGWLTAQQATDALTRETLYSQQLAYYDPATGITPAYSGNIAQWTWQHKNAPLNRYGFSYDGFGRLSGATHYAADANGNLQAAGRHTEQGIAYDKNGNILALKRYANGTLADDLQYAYTGNRLTALTENATPADGNDILPRGTAATATYAYDPNGNLAADNRQNRTYTYNALGLLASVSQNAALTARYTWAADETKLAVEDPQGNGFEYLGNTIARKTASGNGTAAIEIESIAFPHGRILKTSAGYETNYHITDHLGSIRTIVKPNANKNGVQIIEQNDYYPFGQKHKNSQLATSSTNRFLYNGKEKQTTGNVNFLDYGARMYDPTIARWTTTDPLMEKYYAYSSFNFNLGNPINLIDHNGLAPDWVRDLEKDQYVWMDRVTSANNTPEGFLYVGHEDEDILNDLKIASKYKTQNISTVGIGPMGGDNVGPFGSGIFSRTKLLASGYITIDVNVSSGKNEYISENNKEGKYFEGITITAHLGQQSIHPDRDYQTLGQGKLSVIHGKQLQEELLRQNKGDYFSLPGMKWSHASIYIPSSQIKSSKAISAATISIGVTNQNITYIRPIKMFWPLQTKEVFRPF